MTQRIEFRKSFRSIDHTMIRNRVRLLRLRRSARKLLSCIPIHGVSTPRINLYDPHHREYQLYCALSSIVFHLDCRLLLPSDILDNVRLLFAWQQRERERIIYLINSYSLHSTRKNCTRSIFILFIYFLRNLRKCLLSCENLKIDPRANKPRLPTFLFDSTSISRISPTSDFLISAF
jgi:hypothetical protein